MNHVCCSGYSGNERFIKFIIRFNKFINNLINFILLLNCRIFDNCIELFNISSWDSNIFK